jgi:hypothetical protein
MYTLKLRTATSCFYCLWRSKITYSNNQCLFTFLFSQITTLQPECLDDTKICRVAKHGVLFLCFKSQSSSFDVCLRLQV